MYMRTLWHVSETNIYNTPAAGALAIHKSVPQRADGGGVEGLWIAEVLGRFDAAHVLARVGCVCTTGTSTVVYPYPSLLIIS